MTGRADRAAVVINAQEANLLVGNESARVVRIVAAAALNHRLADRAGRAMMFPSTEIRAITAAVPRPAKFVQASKY